MDRLFCLLLGHTWEPVRGLDARRCAHCEIVMGAIELVGFWRRRNWNPETGQVEWLEATDCLALGWPRRVWGHR